MPDKRMLIVGTDFDKCLTPVHFYNLLAPLIHQQMNVEEGTIKKEYRFSDIELSTLQDVFPGCDNAEVLLKEINSYLRKISKKTAFNSQECAEGLFDIFYKHSVLFKVHADQAKRLFEWANRAEEDYVQVYVTTYGDILGCVQGICSKLGLTIHEDQIALQVADKARAGFLVKQLIELRKLGYECAFTYIDDKQAQAQTVLRCVVEELNESIDTASAKRIVKLENSPIINKLRADRAELIQAPVSVNDICFMEPELHHINNAEALALYVDQLLALCINYRTEGIMDPKRIDMQNIVLRFLDHDVDITAFLEEEQRARAELPTDPVGITVVPGAQTTGQLVTMKDVIQTSHI